MSISNNPSSPFSEVDWPAAALLACRNSPNGSASVCPVCHAEALTAAWHLVELLSRKALIDLRCSSCTTDYALTIVLPTDVPGFFPWARLSFANEATRQELVLIAERIQQHAKTMPAAAFTTYPLWTEARWSATTFRWHPQSEAPPIMGIVFDNAEAGLEIFREAERQMNHTDRFEEIRVSIIEGPVPGQECRPGYSVHICPDPEALDAHATMEDFVVNQSVVPFLGQWNRHYPIPGMPELLPRFKREFKKHKEFLLAPVVRRGDGQLWVETKLGIIKNIVHFRYLSEITHEDIDAAAMVLPELITPPRPAPTSAT